MAIIDNRGYVVVDSDPNEITELQENHNIKKAVHTDGREWNFIELNVSGSKWELLPDTELVETKLDKGTYEGDAQDIYDAAVKSKVNYGTFYSESVFKNEVDADYIGEIGAVYYDTDTNKRYFYNGLTYRGIDINSSYPFLKSSTFISDHPVFPDVDFNIVKNAILDIKIFGYSSDEQISLYELKKNDGGNYVINFYLDTGTGNGVSKTNVIYWSDDKYTVPDSGIDTIKVSLDNGKGFQVTIDWNELPDSYVRGSMTYNSARLDPRCFVDGSSFQFSDYSKVKTFDWRFKNTPVYNNELISTYTVLPDEDDDGDTLGNTGMTLNELTNQLVISYYSFDKAAQLWIYDREDLIERIETSVIKPVPTKIIDITDYIDHLQGVTWDNTNNSYWCLGTQKGVSSSNTTRVLINVSSTGELLESTNLELSLQVGMIVHNQVTDTLLIKPNTQSIIYEINKTDKTLIRSRTTNILYNEGLGIDNKNQIVWLANDSGVLRSYNYSDFSLIDTFSYATLPNNPATTTNVEGILIDPLDGALIISADTWLHGENINGNAIFVFDYSGTVGTGVNSPYMHSFYDWKLTESLNIVDNCIQGVGEAMSPIFDFESLSDYISNNIDLDVENCDVEIYYRGSDTNPTKPSEIDDLYRKGDSYLSWGGTVPSEFSKEIAQYRYVQVKIGIKLSTGNKRLSIAPEPNSSFESTNYLLTDDGVTISLTASVVDNLVEIDITDIEGASTKVDGAFSSFGNIGSAYIPNSNKTFLISNPFCSEFRKITIDTFGAVFMLHSDQDDFSSISGNWQGIVSGSTTYYN